MSDNTVLIGNVGRDNAGTYVDVWCGDTRVEVGQSLWIEVGGRHLSVTIDRIDLYGHDVQELDPGFTGRLWVSPSEVASLLAEGMYLQSGAPPLK